jgi:hypothetical protein
MFRHFNSIGPGCGRNLANEYREWENAKTVDQGVQDPDRTQKLANSALSHCRIYSFLEK